MKLKDYDYELPEELIAQKPVFPRSSSKMLVVKDKLEHKHFEDIFDYFEEGDVLVLNETKVIPAKLIGKKSTGAKAEMIITGKEDDLYKVRITANNPREGNELEFEDGLKATIIIQNKDVFYVKFNIDDVEDYLKKYGKLPTPPYVKKELDKNEDYQTAYAKEEGSVAAPTAGFHFTSELLDKIERKGVKVVKVVLHVGFGTFIPVRSENVLDHKMEEEYFEVSEESADAINNRTGRLFAVGTTTLKTLESASVDGNGVKVMKGWSNLFITPEHEFKAGIDVLITNFHLPKSTLLLLVCGFAGRERIFEAYKEAIENKYRFYSFGDAMLLFKEKTQPQ